MKTKTKGQILVSTFLLGTALYLPPDSKRVLSADNAPPPPKKLEQNERLSFGDRGSDVNQLQVYLNSLNYYQGARDGIFGLKTKQAVSQYQADHSLLVDGIAGDDTLSHLLTNEKILLATEHQPSISISEEPNDPATALTADTLSDTLSASAKLIYEGASGKAVTALQTKLAEFGYYEGVDGKFGPKTTSAVMAFQDAHGLKVDGIVGPETKAKLASGELTTFSEKADTSNKTEPEPDSDDHEPSSNSLIDSALALEGVPYQWGGTTPSGFDCSGFIQFVFAEHNKELPRTVKDMYQLGQAVEQLQLGDLVFFTTYRSGASHAGLYIGNNQFIHAGSSQGVTISSLEQNYWSSRYIGAKRL